MTLTDLLKEHGFSALKAEVWAEFVGHVVDLYWAAADELLSPTAWAAFKSKKGAMGKPKPFRGGAQIRVPLEDAITAEIGHKAEMLRKRLPAGHFLRRHEVQFGFESLVASRQRTGRHSKKIDLRVVALQEGGPELAIEAKPIVALADIESKYLADEGLGCFFVDDSAYAQGPLGAMLAYSMSPEGLSMKEEILKKLIARQPCAISIRRIDVAAAGAVDCSHHDRMQWKLGPITILHLERNFPLDVQPVPAIGDPSAEAQGAASPSRVGGRKTKVGRAVKRPPEN